MSSVAIVSIWICSLFLTAGLAWIAGRRSLIITGAAANSDMIVADCEETTTPPQPETIKKRGGSVFDNMPPVETVRQQAKAILTSEDIWGSPEVCAQVSLTPECFTRARGMPAPEMIWAGAGAGAGAEAV